MRAPLTDHEQIEAGPAHLRSKPDRFDGAGLADKPVDRLQFCRGRERQTRQIGRTIELSGR